MEGCRADRSDADGGQDRLFRPSEGLRVRQMHLALFWMLFDKLHRLEHVIEPKFVGHKGVGINARSEG
jgi:hypothetical protein